MSWLKEDCLGCEFDVDGTGIVCDRLDPVNSCYKPIERIGEASDIKETILASTKKDPNTIEGYIYLLNEKHGLSIKYENVEVGTEIRIKLNNLPGKYPSMIGNIKQVSSMLLSIGRKYDFNPKEEEKEAKNE